MDKAAIVQDLCAQIAVQEDTLRKAVEAATEGATHEEAKPENDKDTRALEASYLAGAQAAKVRELAAAQNALRFMPLRACTQVDLGALVTLGSKRYFVAPYGGGLRVADVVVVTPASPVGRALMGRAAGEVAEIGGREVEIDAVE